MRVSKRTARKEALSKGYRSNFELSFAKRLTELKLKAQYESEKIYYVQPEKIRIYHPDWTIGKNVYIETKGRFTASDRQKILYVMKSNLFCTIYLLFQNSKVTLSKVSKTTYGDWCTKNGVLWADIRDEKTWRKWFG